MNRYTPRKSNEFEARQMCFDFGAACRFVAELAASVRKSLGGWWKKVRPTPPKPVFKMWQQLVLEADDFHQLTFAV